MSAPGWVRALGIDFGLARIGVAVSDDLGMLAHPLETVDGKDPNAAVARIVEIAIERGSEDLVLGLPVTMEGKLGSAAERVRRFGSLLGKSLPDGVRMHEVDEAHTTRDAMAKLHQAGRNEKNSRDIIDQAAAVEILQRWLDDRAGESSVPDEAPW